VSGVFLLCSPFNRPVTGFGTMSGSVLWALVRSWGQTEARRGFLLAWFFVGP
jgi:hypothetical protein